MLSIITLIIGLNLGFLLGTRFKIKKLEKLD